MDIGPIREIGDREVQVPQWEKEQPQRRETVPEKEREKENA